MIKVCQFNFFHAKNILEAKIFDVIATKDEIYTNAEMVCEVY